MTASRWGRAARVSSVALLTVALGAGVPVHAEAEHDGEGAHYGAPEHAHGLALVQHDLRLERASAPVFAAVEAAVVLVAIATPRSIAVTPRDETIAESRAPPTGLPRAPPA